MADAGYQGALLHLTSNHGRTVGSFSTLSGSGRKVRRFLRWSCRVQLPLTPDTLPGVLRALADELEKPPSERL